MKIMIKLHSLFFVLACIVRLNTAYEKQLWPDRVIAYAYSGQIDSKLRFQIESLLNSFQFELKVDVTPCIEFVTRVNETNYILFEMGDDCSTEIGFTEGVNYIFLNKNCFSNGVITRQIYHKLGFNYEHLRPDRDEYINVDINNTLEDEKVYFELRSAAKENIETTPYDYFSVLHFNSNQFQKKSMPVITTKFDSLWNGNLLADIPNKLSKLDVYKIQHEYECLTRKLPYIFYEYDEDDFELKADIEKRFMTEANFLRKDKMLIRSYLNKSFETCGMDHYWPYDYPLVTSTNKYYHYYCEEKKKPSSKCLFSIECGPRDEAVCVRFFFKKTGTCAKLTKVGNKVNDAFFKIGAKVKDIFG